MKQIALKAFAKINLSLDVPGLLDNGYHEVSMVMQQILLCDDVHIKWQDRGGGRIKAAGTVDGAAAGETAAADNHGGLEIKLTTNLHYLPTDNQNLAYRAAELMAREAGHGRAGRLLIHVKKRIPVAAGLAGGSADAAAVLHGLRKLWELPMSLGDMCRIGAALGSDVPFCIMAQAAAHRFLSCDFPNDPLLTHCALATGTGTDLTPIKGLRSHLAISKPPISVSTAEVYRGIDEEDIPVRPDNQELIRGLAENNMQIIQKNMVNVLENYTLKRYPIVMYTKDKLRSLCPDDPVLMSGSGPSVYVLCNSMDRAQDICRAMLRENKESFWTRTTW